MKIGVPKEIKAREYRVGLTPESVQELVRDGHTVFVEDGLGTEIGLDASDYLKAGAVFRPDPAEIFAEADMIVKVKEPHASEIAMLREGQILFTYLHLAADPAQTHGLLQSGAIAIAYETVTDKLGGLPLLAPMSQVAGRMSIQAGAHCLEMARGGRGMLLGGVPGVKAAKVVILGGGVVGTNAARMAMGLEAHVTVVDISLNRLQSLDLQFGSKLSTVFSTAQEIERQVMAADLVVGAVLVPGAAAPKLVSEDMIRKMKRGAVIVDVAIDQGGCFETSHPTTHDEPTYIVHDVVHYCVANMPGGVARTSTFALNNVTLPFVREIASKGVRMALLEDDHLRNGLNIYHGQLTYEAVARDLCIQYVPPHSCLTA